MKKTKQPKRIKQWVNEHRGSWSITYYAAYNNRRLALANSGVNPLRTAVRLIEVRRGEVVVNVKALEEAFAVEAQGAGHLWDAQAALKAAIKKVGVR